MFPFLTVEKNREQLICVWNATENAQGGLTCTWICEPSENVSEMPLSTEEETGGLPQCA
jgi:hypothetical protein